MKKLSHSTLMQFHSIKDEDWVCTSVSEGMYWDTGTMNAKVHVCVSQVVNEGRNKKKTDTLRGEKNEPYSFKNI